MPRDLIAFPEAPVETKPDLSTPSLEGLSWLLRHPEEWPGHEWNFCLVEYAPTRPACGTAGCALGLAGSIWGTLARDKPAEVFGIPQTTVEDIFYGASYWMLRLCGADFNQVTPAMVADELDRYLADSEVRRTMGDQ